MSAFPNRAVAQATVVVKAMCRAWGVTPLSVELVEGTTYEPDAWRKEAEKYLIAQSQRVKYKPDTRDWSQEFLQ